MLQRRLAIILAAAVGAAPSADAQQRRQQQQAPAAPPLTQGPLPWAEGVPEAPPQGSIGVIATMDLLCPHNAPSFQFHVMNTTSATIRFAAVLAELFIGDRREIVHFNIELADPGEYRSITVPFRPPCWPVPSRILIREIALCTRAVRWSGNGCGARFVSFLPPQLNLRVAALRPFPVEFAPDFER